MIRFRGKSKDHGVWKEGYYAVVEKRSFIIPKDATLTWGRFDVREDGILGTIEVIPGTVEQVKKEKINKEFVNLDYIEKLEKAIDESLKLQSHYAKLLNMYDEGERRQFKNRIEWMVRIDEVAKNQADLCGRLAKGDPDDI